MDSSVLPKDEIWFLRVCHHISNAVYGYTSATPLGFFDLFSGEMNFTIQTPIFLPQTFPFRNLKLILEGLGFESE